MPTLAIVNPVAGNGRSHRIWERLRARVEAVQAWRCVSTERAGHARELAHQAASAGYERVVAVGGDGTVNEVANGLAGTRTALAIIPTGSGNDSVRNLAIPSQPAEAAMLAAHGDAREVDLGTIRLAGRATYFLNVAGFGFDAEVAYRVNRPPWMWLKVLGSTTPYVATVLYTLWAYRSARMRLDLDGQVHEQPVFLVAVANGPCYGGGMRIVPPALPDDGLLDVCVVRQVSRIEVLKLVPRMYSGGHVGHPAVKLARCRELSVDADCRVRCHADGEIVGELPARFGVVPGALRCVVGQAAH